MSDVTPARAADIPSLDRLLNDADFAPALSRFSRTQVTAALRETLAALRQQAMLGELHHAMRWSADHRKKCRRAFAAGYASASAGRVQSDRHGTAYQSGAGSAAGRVAGVGAARCSVLR
jgi:hypothetical protein